MGWQGDWSSAEALKGRRPIDLINQITAAYSERQSAWWTPAFLTAPSFNPGEILRVQPLSFQSSPIRLTNKIIGLGTRYYKHNYTLPISDFFDGSSPADRYTVANIEAALGEELIPPPPRYSLLSREWLVQMYKVLNLYRVTYRVRQDEPERIQGNISNTTFVSYYNPLQKTKQGVNDWTDWFDAYRLGIGGDTISIARVGAYRGEDGFIEMRYCKTDVYYRQVTSTPEFPVGKKYHGKLMSLHVNAQRTPAGELVLLDRYGNAPDPQDRTDFSQLDLWYDLGTKTAEENPEPEYVGTYETGEPTEGGAEEAVGYSIGTVVGFFDWAVEGGFEYGDW